MPTPGERFDRSSGTRPYKPESRALDPREVTIQPGWNVRDMSSPETREWISTLKVSILTAGYDQTKPISVRYDRKTGTATLVDGQCRLTACTELRNEGHEIWIPCVVTEGDEAALTAESMAGNAGQPLTQWEIGAGCRRLVKYSWSPAMIAAHICKTIRYVNEAIALANVPVEAKEMLRDGSVTTGAVLHAVSGKDGDSLPKLKERVAAAPKPAQTSIPGTAKPPKPVARPKKPSAAEQTAKKAPAVLELADAMYRLIMDEQPWIELELAAKAYGTARGL